jgi:hypothetical protein
MVLSDYNSLGVPELTSLEFVELADQEDVPCLVYITDFEGTPAPAEEAPEASQEQKSSSGPCFIATAVYGSYDAPQVKILRTFRDEFLAQSKAGKLLIRAYYMIGPACSKPLIRYNRLRSGIRYILNLFIAFLRR